MEAVIFIGIQAVGKSTFYRERFSDTHVRINLDMLKTRHREDIILRACLEAKQPFVVDNTNPAKEERKKYIEEAKKQVFKYPDISFNRNLKKRLREMRKDHRKKKFRYKEFWGLQKN